MNPGKMDRRITVQVRSLSKDAAGGRVESWSDAFQCWAELVSNASNEGVTAGAERSSSDKQFRIRYRSNIESGTHRVLYQLKFYDITGIEEEGRQDRLLLTCRSLQALTH